MNARYYVPNTNRMASPDTIVPDPTNPQSFNRYSYVGNRPLNFTDPTGHRECEFVDYCSPPIAPPVLMPSPSLVGFNASNTDPLPLLFYQHPDHFQMTAGVEYFPSGLGGGAEVFTPLLGQGEIPDIPGVIHEGYPVLFSIEDRDSDGIVEWVRYIEVGGEVRILFAAEWQFSGGLGFETFPLPAEKDIPVIGSVGATLVLEPQFTRPGSIVLRGVAILGVGSPPSGSYIEFVTSQTSPRTIETVGSLIVDGSTVAEIRFRGYYDPSQSSLISVPPDYNVPH